MFGELLSRSGLSLDRLKSFCLVGEAGGVTKAARGDPAKQSLFSRQVKELEEFFGVALVRRSGRGVALTVAGRQLYTLARAQLSTLADFKQVCAQAPLQLTIAGGESLIQWVLLPKVGELRSRLPDVVLRLVNLSTAEITNGLTEGTIDLGVIRRGGHSAHVDTAALGVLAFSLFVPAKLLPTGRKSGLKVGDWKRLPLATLEGEGQFRRGLECAAGRARAKLCIAIELSSFPLVARAVRSGAFAGILPSIARGEFIGVDVVEVHAPWLKTLHREMVLAWNPRLACVRPVLSRVVAVFRDLCQLSL
jgi:DNA-binding transcriptional LysR family regulator